MSQNQHCCCIWPRQRDLLVLQKSLRIRAVIPVVSVILSKNRQMQIWPVFSPNAGTIEACCPLILVVTWLLSTICRQNAAVILFDTRTWVEQGMPIMMNCNLTDNPVECWVWQEIWIFWKVRTGSCMISWFRQPSLIDKISKFVDSFTRVRSTAYGNVSFACQCHHALWQLSKESGPFWHIWDVLSQVEGYAIHNYYFHLRQQSTPGTSNNIFVKRR